jgi:signal transduction histidine kinase
MKNPPIVPLCIIYAALVACMLSLWRLGSFDAMDLFLYDLLTQQQPPSSGSDTLIILEYEEAALNPQKPAEAMSIQRLAELLRALLQLKPKTIALDLFAFSKVACINSIGELPADVLYSPRMVFGVGYQVPAIDASDNGSPSEIPPAGPGVRFRRACGALLPIVGDSVAQGHLVLSAGDYGRVRKIPLFIQFVNRQIPAFSLRAVMNFRGLPPDSCTVYPDRIVCRGSSAAKQLIVPCLAHGEYGIPFSERRLLQRVPLDKVCTISDKRVVPLAGVSLENKMVFLGVRSLRFGRYFATPASDATPSLYIHASIASGILNGHNIKVASKATWVWLYLGIAAVIFLLTIFTTRPIVKKLFLCALPAALLSVWGTFQFFNFFLPGSLLLCIGILTVLLIVGRDYFIRFRDKRLVEIGENISGILHDLKPKLGRIRDYSGELIGGDGTDKKKLERIFSEADRCFRECDSLNRYVSRKTVEKTIFRLAPVVRAVIDRMEEVLESKRIRAIQNVPTDLTLCARQIDITRVFENLIRNAVHATGEGGTIETGARDEGQGIYVYVRDTGCGIGQQHLKHIFEFGYTTDRVSGSGQGLAIVKKIIEEHEGKILKPVSAAGAGTTIRFLLPKSAVKPQRSTQ